jgi:enoyl-CoA hydratase
MSDSLAGRVALVTGAGVGIGRATALALAQGPSIAIQFTKRLINKDLEARITQVMDLSLALEALTLDTSDYNEAISSFLEKRPPTYGPVYGSEGTHK